MAREQVTIAECKTMWLHAAVWGRKRLRAVVMNSDGHEILALSARQLPHDWQSRYGHRLLLETLVDAIRFRGTCYRAANWIYVVWSGNWICLK